LPLTPNRDAFTPKLDLSYSYGAGNGPFGAAVRGEGLIGGLPGDVAEPGFRAGIFAGADAAEPEGPRALRRRVGGDVGAGKDR
jgi:hypothetical protein